MAKHFMLCNAKIDREQSWIKWCTECIPILTTVYNNDDNYTTKSDQYQPLMLSVCSLVDVWEDVSREVNTSKLCIFMQCKL